MTRVMNRLNLSLDEDTWADLDRLRMVEAQRKLEADSASGWEDDARLIARIEGAQLELLAAQ